MLIMPASFLTLYFCAKNKDVLSVRVYDMLQVVNMQFDGGATATLQMVAFTQRLCAREVKIYGTKVRTVMQYVSES